MHSTINRIQNVFGFFTTAAFVLAACVALSVVLFPQTPSAEIAVRNVQVVKGRPHYHSYKKEEYAHIKFDLEADFTSLFNWNTKQLFVWVEAVYPGLSPDDPESHAVIWDTMIHSHAQENSPWTEENLKSYLPAFLQDGKSPSKLARARAMARDAAASAKKAAKGGEPPIGKLSLKNVKPKYQITDVTGKLAERANVTLKVGWNVQPWVGAMIWTLPEGRQFGKWKGVQGGKSEAFNMPSLKGKKSETVVGQETTPEAGKAAPVA